jgi:lysophospholipase L1-like esterase
MAPYRTIQRGYGGSKYSDVAVFAERLLHPHQYRALVVFVGNDVAGKPEDHTPGQVEQWVRSIVGVSHEHQPESPVLLIEVTPTEKRFSVWPRIRDVNARLREVALTTANTYFIATAGQFLDPQGNPRSELFGDDRLHLNSAGYDLWSELIRRRLDEVLRMTAEFQARKSTAVEAAPK